MSTQRSQLAATVLACGLFLLAIPPGRGVPADKPHEKPPAPDAKPLDFARLPNDELLKQAAAIQSRSLGDYLAGIRSLAGAEAQFEDATRQLANLAPPKADPKKPDGDAETVAKAVVDAAKLKAEFAKQKLKLTLVRKQLQERVAASVEGVQSASAAFQATLDDLKPYVLELNLRVKDETLPAEKFPREFEAAALAKQRAELAAERDKLKEKLAEVRKTIEAGAKEAEDAGKALVTADADVTEASRVYSREQSRKELEKKYAGKSSDELVAEIDKLVRDGQGLKGTYELAFQRFAARAAAADALRKELAALKPPEAKSATITRAEDVEPAIKATEALINFHSGRASKIESLKTSLGTLAKQGAEFEGDAAVSDDHLFKLQVLSALIVKAGQAEKLPQQASTKRLEDAAARAKKLASEVRAGTDKAKADLDSLDKELTEATSAGDAVRQQLDGLKQSREATLFALRFEDQLAKMSTAEVLDQFQKLRTDLIGSAAALKEQETHYRKAVAAVAEARAKLDALKDPFLRAAEEQGQAEKQKIAAELRKGAGLERTAIDPATKPIAEPKKQEDNKPETGRTPSGSEGVATPPPPPLEGTTARLAAFQQQLAARVRVLDERTEKTAGLLESLDDLDTTGTTYAKTVNQMRQFSLQLNGAAVELKKRVGRGELDGGKIPDGITDALAVESRNKLDADATAVVNLLSQVRQDRDALKKPDSDRDGFKTLSKEQLSFAGQRIDLLGDIKKLAADYKVPKKDRPESEQKRLDQTAADRMQRDAGSWDWLHSLDKSQSATNLAALMETYYREVVEIEEREENLRKQKKAIDDLVELTARERAAIQKGLPLLQKELVRLDSLKEEEALLARARVKPETADELLKAYQAKTGRALPKPLPLPEKDRAAAVDEIAAKLFERHVEAEAARKWDNVLMARLATDGLTAEAGVYQDELARLNATSAANARRVQALTGNAPPEPGKLGTGEQTQLPAASGEIGKTRGELTAVRRKGIQGIGIRIGIILLAAIFLPRIILFVIRRALGVGKTDEAGNPSMVLTAIGAFLKAAIWVAAIAMILSTLGFDVTAIVTGLGIGGLAIGLAAQPMISDVIAAIVIFAERRFKIGDVVKFGSDEPARVVGLTWRSTALRNPEGLVLSVPNRKVTETTVVNLTKSGQTYDSLAVTVHTAGDVNKVLDVINKSMAECANLSPDHGVSVKKFNQKGDMKIVEYRFWWFLKDYEARNKTRDEVFARIGAGLADENMAGTEVTLA